MAEENVTMTQEEIDAKVAEAVAAKLEDAVKEQLKDIKGKLDSSFAERDAANAKLAEIELKAKEEKIKLLQEEGKHKEALELLLAESKKAEEEARNGKLALEKRNNELQRDLLVRRYLSNYTFRSEKAGTLAFNSIVDELTQNESGVWLHKSGATLDAFIKTFSEDEENAFLYKQKVSSGSGDTGGGRSTTTDGKTKKFSEMSQAEVIKLGEQGKLPRQQKT